MTLDTLQLLQQLLHSTTLNGEAPDFEETALRVLTARRELAAAIAAATSTGT
jgi:hypothetical protein